MSPQPRQTRRALLGGAILLLLGAIAGGIFLLDDVLGALRSTYRITVELPEAAGLVAGSAVWVGGNPVGTVETIDFRPARGDRSSAMLVTVALPGDVRPHVRRDSDARITSERMIGDPVLDLIPGSARTAALAEGDTLVARPRPDAAAVTRRAAALRAELDSLRAATAELTPLLARRSAGFARVERHLGAAQREYAALMSAIEQSPALALLGGEEIAQVTGRLEEVLAEVAGSLARQQERLQESGAAEGMVRLQARADTVRAALADLQEVIRVRGGTLHRMSSDSALIRAVTRARTELDSLIAEVRRNPLRFAL